MTTLVQRLLSEASNATVNGTIAAAIWNGTLGSNDTFANGTTTASPNPKNNGTNSTFNKQPNPFANNTNDGGDNEYEFMAFVLWYILLVLCCIIPTCFAYRRRRLLEQRIALQQQNVRQMQQSNLLILSSLQRNGNVDEEPAVVEARTLQYKRELEATTMTVEEADLLMIGDEAAQTERNDEPSSTGSLFASWRKGRVKSLHGDGGVDEQQPTSSRDNDLQDVDLSIEPRVVEGGFQHDDEDGAQNQLQLPPSSRGDDDATADMEEDGPQSTRRRIVNANRTVPATCTICLSAYEVDDTVSWSPNESCCHAFHRDCVVSWLVKKQEPKCPICRQDFCTLAESDSLQEQQQIRLAPPFRFSDPFTASFYSMDSRGRLYAVRSSQAGTNTVGGNTPFIVGSSLSSTALSTLSRSIPTTSRTGVAGREGAVATTSPSAEATVDDTNG